MVNYGCDFSQSEMEQYFEWIIITFILKKNCPALSWARLFFPLVRRFSDGKGESKSLAFNAERVYPLTCAFTWLPWQWVDLKFNARPLPPHPMKISTQNMSIRRMWTDFLKSRNIVYWGPLTKNKLWARFLLTRNKSVWALKWRED